MSTPANPILVHTPGVRQPLPEIEAAARRTPFRSAKIQERHLERLAIVYVRQSTPQQVLEHRESRERQYALADYAATLGWSRERVLLIDEDQGHSGKSAAARAGFHRLLAEVTMDHVGLVLGLEMSRLARSNKDWHQRLDVCALFQTFCFRNPIFLDRVAVRGLIYTMALRVRPFGPERFRRIATIRRSSSNKTDPPPVLCGYFGVQQKLKGCSPYTV